MRKALDRENEEWYSRDEKWYSFDEEWYSLDEEWYSLDEENKDENSGPLLMLLQVDHINGDQLQCRRSCQKRVKARSSLVNK